MIFGCMNFIHLETTSWRYHVRLFLLNYISMWWTSMDLGGKIQCGGLQWTSEVRFNSLLFNLFLKWLVLIATFMINIFIYEFVIIFFVFILFCIFALNFWRKLCELYSFCLLIMWIVFRCCFPFLNYDFLRSITFCENIYKLLLSLLTNWVKTL